MSSRNGSGATITPSSTLKTICEGCRHTDALIPCPTDRITADAISRPGGSVKVMLSISVGYEHINIATARERGIVGPTRPMSSPMPQPISPCSGITVLKVEPGHVAGYQHPLAGSSLKSASVRVKTMSPTS